METEPAFASASCTRVISVQLCWSLESGSGVFFPRESVFGHEYKGLQFTVSWICLSPAKDHCLRKSLLQKEGLSDKPMYGGQRRKLRSSPSKPMRVPLRPFGNKCPSASSLALNAGQMGGQVTWGPPPGREGVPREFRPQTGGVEANVWYLDTSSHSANWRSLAPREASTMDKTCLNNNWDQEIQDAKSQVVQDAVGKVRNITDT